MATFNRARFFFVTGDSKKVVEGTLSHIEGDGWKCDAEIFKSSGGPIQLVRVEIYAGGELVFVAEGLSTSKATWDRNKITIKLEIHSVWFDSVSAESSIELDLGTGTFDANHIASLSYACATLGDTFAQESCLAPDDVSQKVVVQLCSMKNPGPRTPQTLRLVLQPTDVFRRFAKTVTLNGPAAKIAFVSASTYHPQTFVQTLPPERLRPMTSAEVALGARWWAAVGPVSWPDAVPLLHDTLERARAESADTRGFAPGLLSIEGTGSGTDASLAMLGFAFDYTYDAPSLSKPKNGRLVSVTPIGPSIPVSVRVLSSDVAASGTITKGAITDAKELWNDPAGLSGFQGSIGLGGNQANPGLPLILGALAAQVRQWNGATIELGIRTGFPHYLALSDNDSLPASSTDIQVTLHALGLASIFPCGTDSAPDAIADDPDSDEQALVLNLGSTPSAKEDAYLLSAEEAYAPNKPRQFSLLIEQREQPSPFRMLVVDPRPFLVGAYRVDAAADSDREVVAVYSENTDGGPAWQVAGNKNGFTLWLPPQAIGETADKGDRFAVGKQPIDPTTPIAYRFSPPAQLRLHSAWNNQAYGEAPWNVRRVFGYPGQRAPGATLVRATFELLYGLTTTVDAERQPFRLQLAELAARIGALPPRLRFDPPSTPAASAPPGGGEAPPDKLPDLLGRAASLLETLRRRVSSRLAVLELYNPGETPRRLDDYRSAASGELVLEQGMVFRLRRKAQMMHPILLNQHYADGRSGDFKDFLAGGAVWGFESENIFDAVMRQTTSTSGLLKALRFSALGGYGDQRADFDEGRTRISHGTQMGRVSTYVVERAGRIGVFWNRARHVIVYQRSVLPGAQFEDEQNPGNDGRPILRKMSEYVEILEPRRAVRDPSAPRLPARMAEACTFVSTRILVNGAWGRDITGGWVVPLWDRAAKPIYTRPNIQIELAGADNEPNVSARILEPQRLVFYTNTERGKGADTDRWDPVTGIDYLDAPIVDPATIAMQGGPSSYLGANLDDDLNKAQDDWPRENPEPLGLYAFTFPLEPQARAANLVAGSSNARISARLDNLTFMRAAPKDASSGQMQWWAKGEKALALIHERFGRLRADLERCDLAGAIELLKDFAPAFKEPQRQLDDIATKQMSQLARPDQAFSRLSDALSGTLRADLQRSRETLQSWADRLPEDLQQHCRDGKAAVAARLSAQIAGLRSRLLRVTEPVATNISVVGQALEQWLGRSRACVDTLKSGLTALTQSVAKLVDLADNNPTFDSVRARLEAVRYARTKWIAEVKMAVAALRGTALESLVSQIAYTLATQNDLLADQERKIRALPANSFELKELRSLVAGLRGALKSADDSLAALGVQIDGVSKRINTLLPQESISNWTNALNEELQRIVNGASNLCQQGVTEVVRAVEERLRDLSEHESGLDFTVSSALEQARDQLAPLLNVSDSVCGRLQSLSRQLNSQIQDLRDALDSATDDATVTISKWLRAAERPLDDLYDAYKRETAPLQNAPSFRDPSATLHLLRAVGEGPLLPKMEINRDRLAYVFDDYAAQVRSTPAAALIHRVKGDLEALGLRIPFDKLGDRLLPPALRDFDISKVLPDFSGLKNSSLFAGLKMPDLSENGVSIRHGFDPDRQLAWLKADLDVAMNDAVPVFSLAGLAMTLRRGRLRGNAQLSVGGDGSFSQRKYGEIQGTWSLAFGGYTFVSFVDTTLRLNEGGSFTFDVQPNKVALDPALSWLQDVIHTFSDPEAGFTLTLKQRNGLPSGVRAELNLPLPPNGVGVVTINGLSLSAFMDLDAFQDTNGAVSQTPSFALSAGFGLGRPELPFALFIAFLGGGGFMTCTTRYYPSINKYDVKLDIGFSVGAGAAFGLGPIQGSVVVMIGMRASYYIPIGDHGGGLQAALTFLIAGRVRLFGIVTVSLQVYLMLVYGADKSLVGTGYISVSVRISRFFKVSYSTAVNYRLSGGSSATAALAATERPVHDLVRARRMARC